MKLENLKLIQTVLDDAVNNKELAGVNLLVYKDGNEIGYWQSGLSDVENNYPYKRDTICRMYSMSKTVTCVAAMILIEEGKLDLADELSKYLPSFKNMEVCYDKGRNGKTVKANRPILIQDLMNMTAGFSYGAYFEDAPRGQHLTSDLIAELNKDVVTDNKITTQDFAERLSKIPLDFEPGTDYSYSFCADVIGAVIEKITNQKFSDFLKQRIFYPLGMHDTDFYVPSDKQIRLSKVYRSVNDGKNNHLELFTNCNLGIQDKMDHAPSFESGGAGLCSTVDDYMKFANMLVNGGELNGIRILQKKTVDYIRSARLRENLQQKFNQKMEHLSGYTYCNFMRIAFEPGRCKSFTDYEEFGWDGWLGPYLSVDIKNNLTIVMTIQRCDSGTTSTTRRVKNIIYSSL